MTTTMNKIEGSNKANEPNQKLARCHHFSQGFANSAQNTKKVSTYLFIGCTLGLFVNPILGTVAGAAAMMTMAGSYLAEPIGNISSFKTKDYAKDIEVVLLCWTGWRRF
ncbi:MAG: hypothetical protein CO093_08620 [Alphaproteobacteria bacterium CG_4_9_14_3_um_filter_47_13]|nr:MAG: hypothetical protein CO093_08620 [Alphaproteobacteria bacterium CG_4_9_14_3_um_filter_47_13]